MSDLARYLACAMEMPVLEYPKITVSFEESGISFAPASEGEINFIEYCLAHGYNADSVFKKTKTIKVEDGSIYGVVRQVGDSIIVLRDGRYYKSIDPLESAAHEVGEIVDGTYYKGAKILKYTGNGFYEVGFTDGSIAHVHINSMKPYKSGISQPPATARRNPDMEFADEVAEWIRECGLAQVRGGEVSVGESKNGKKYKAIGFSYPRAIDGEIQIYGPKFILVRYTFFGKKDSFTADSPEEFHTLMTERFGSFIRDY